MARRQGGLRAFHRRLRGVPTPAHAACRRQTEAFRAAVVVVQVYYVAVLYLVATHVKEWLPRSQVGEMAPLWPVRWMDWTGIEIGVHLLMTLALVGAVAAAWDPACRWARALCFVGLLGIAAFVNSFGKIGHAHHAWVLSSFVLTFLPIVENAPSSRARIERQIYLTVVRAAQAMVLITYSLSGMWKVVLAVQQGLAGEPTAFGPDGLATLIAHRLMQTGTETLLGAFLIEHHVVSWPLHVGVIYLQCTAIIVAFRPVLHRLWALGLIGFHIGTTLAMGITFSKNILLLGILLVASPWAASRAFTIRDAVSHFPLLGGALARLGVRPSAASC